MQDYGSWLLLWNIGQSQGESMKHTKEPYLAMRKLAVRFTCISEIYHLKIEQLFLWVCVWVWVLIPTR